MLKKSILLVTAFLQKDFLAYLFISAIFLLFCLWRFQQGFPPGLNHDAAWQGLYAFDILNGESFAVFTDSEGGSGQETLFHYVLALLFQVLGTSRYTIEITSTLFGYISALFFLWFSRLTVGNKKIAFLGSALFTSSSALVTYSRSGWRLISLVPFWILLVASLKRYVAEPLISKAVWVGVFSGLAFYTYYAGRSAIVLFVLFWVVQFFLSKTKKNTLKHFLISFVFFVITLLPMINYAVNNFHGWMGRANALGFGRADSFAYLRNTATSIKFFNFSANGNDFFISFPVLDGPAYFLWVVGFVVCLLRFKKHWLELLVFFCSLLPGIVSVPSFHRSIASIVSVFIFVNIALLYLHDLVKERIGKSIIEFLLVATFFCSLLVSFQRLYEKKETFNWGFYPETYVVGTYIAENQLKNVVIYADNWPKDSLTFLTSTDFQRTPSYLNYQGYSFPSSDAIHHLASDISSNMISAELSSFVIERKKYLQFVKRMEQIGYNIRIEDQIFSESSELVAYVVVLY